MKVLLINGSPRKNGNTFAALSECAGELQKYGVETEIFQIGNEPVRGCTACGGCSGRGSCVFTDDVLGEMLGKMRSADGIIIGSPTYYAGPNGALCALLDRAFYSAGESLRHKAAAAVAVCRRGGASATLDRLNKYFTISEMPVVSSQYWNIVHGCAPGEAVRDEEGMQTMRTLGRNMAFTLSNLAGKGWPEAGEDRVATNFIR